VADALLGIPPTAAAGFVGADVCGACHVAYHADWSGTLHPEAWNNLPAFGQTNPGCLPCHTVGYGEPGGYVDQTETPHLDGVQCENCHGGAADHLIDPHGVQPAIDRSAEMCGACHTDAHHPTFDEWETSGHADSAADAHGIPSCFGCHAPLGEQGNPPALLDVECAACHDPHAQTGNDAIPPDPGRDSQLKFPEYVAPTQANTEAECTDATRFNLCGQCHHSRGRVWTSTSRGPHHSLQGNVLYGEMPVPDGVTLLVANQATTHSTAEAQCATCHMYKEDHGESAAEDGRWSESYAGGGPSMPGNVVHAASWDGLTLGAQWEVAGPTLVSAVETYNDVDVNGDGTVIYESTYSGGTATLDSSLWGEAGLVTADVTSYLQVTTFIYVGGQVDWLTSHAEVTAEALVQATPPYPLGFVALAHFDGPGGNWLPVDYPAYLGGVTEGQWGTLADVEVEKIAITGHEWVVNTERCNDLPGCHSSSSVAEAALAALQAIVETGLTDLEARLGDPLLWEYSCCGGPPDGTPGQDQVPDEIKQVRFLVKYVEGDASLGAHNPGYVQSMITGGNNILDGYGGTWPPAAGAWWGACCDAGSVCLGTMTEGDCTTAGGTWYQGDDCADEEFICP
jgi:hypothetical protein